MKKSKRDEAIEAAVDLYRNRIDVDCKNGSGFFKEHINKDGSVERRPAGHLNRNYWYISLDGVTVFAHRLRWAIEKGEIPKDRVVNHKNNNPSDNSIENLELVTMSRNCKNKLKQHNNKSGVPGVWLRHGKWHVCMPYGDRNGRITVCIVLSLDVARIIRDRFFIKYLLEGDKDVSNKEEILEFLRECHNPLNLTENEKEKVFEYNHLIYSTIDELCGESYAFNRTILRGQYVASSAWKPDNNIGVSIDEQIYLKVLEAVEDRGELGLWRKKNNTYLKIQNKFDKQGYAVCKIFGISLRVHRIIWMLHNGVLRSDKIIDHIDGNRSNNRIENLCIISSLANIRKRHKKINAASKYLGIYWIDRIRKWSAIINMIDCQVYLGVFSSETEAATVRDRAYVLRLFEEPIIKNKEDKKIFIQRCKNRLNLTENQIKILGNHAMVFCTKDLSLL